MVKIIVWCFCSFILFSCKGQERVNKHKLNQEQEVKFFTSYKDVNDYVGIKDSLNNYFENLNWFSMPPVDEVFYGLNERGDTIIKINRAEVPSEIITLNKTTFNSDSIIGVHYKGKGSVSVGNFPTVYHISNDDYYYIMEGTIAGCNGKACESFFVIVK